VNEKTLLRIALICTIIGIAVLFFISSNIEVTEKTIDKINKDNLGEDVKVKGVIDRVTQTNSTIFLELTQPQSITIILFSKQNISLEKGDYIEVIGEIDEYEGSLEIIGQRVRVIS